MVARSSTPTRACLEQPGDPHPHSHEAAFVVKTNNDRFASDMALEQKYHAGKIIRVAVEQYDGVRP